MITAKCPLRISLAGGGSDLEAYRNQFGSSAVLSFSVNLYTYVTVFRDLFGQNSAKGMYNVSYSKSESVDQIEQIRNDVARESARHFSSKPFSCWFTSDIPSHGSGLASSSSYTLSMIQALAALENIELSKRQIVDLSWKVEKKFNQLTGFQDPFGCSFGGINFLEKVGEKDVTVESLDSNFLKRFQMFLVPTDITRSSTEILSNSTEWKFDKHLLDSAYDMRSAIKSNDEKSFVEIFRRVWQMKKQMSPDIIGNDELACLDDELLRCPKVLCHRLIGAGGGGYFFVIAEKEMSDFSISSHLQKPIQRILVDNNGLRFTRIE